MMSTGALAVAHVDGGCYSPLDAPSILDALGNNVARSAKFLAPLHGRERNARVRQPGVVPAIPALLLRCRPPAVARLVVAVYVDAVDRVSRRRSRAHILQERQKVGPSVAHLDSASTVIGVVFVGGKVAPDAHVAPCAVLRWLPRRVTVFAVVIVPAAAAFAGAIAEPPDRGRFLSAAVTATEDTPVPAAVGVGIRQNNPSPEPLSSEVHPRVWHSRSIQ
jgi:hypothetical protein